MADSILIDTVSVISVAGSRMSHINSFQLQCQFQHGFQYSLLLIEYQGFESIYFFFFLFLQIGPESNLPL